MGTSIYLSFAKACPGTLSSFVSDVLNIGQKNVEQVVMKFFLGDDNNFVPNIVNLVPSALFSLLPQNF